MGSRRLRGQGTIRQRHDGVWMAAISMGTLNGKRIRPTFYGPDERTVTDKLNGALALVGTGGTLPSKLPLGDWLRSWIETAARDVSPRTAAQYRHIIEGMPAWLRAVQLGKLNGGHVQAWVDQLAAAPRSSPRTVAWKRNTLRAALNDARRRGIVERNAAALARVPRQRRPKRTVLTAADCRTILAALAGWRYQPAAVVAMGCGLRQGEMLALGWEDVTSRAIIVRASLTRLDGRFVRVPTKTEASAATVPVPAFVRHALDGWDVVQAAEWRAAHPADRPTDIEDRRKAGHVFTTERGMPVHGSVLTHQFQARLRAAKLPVIAWHDLRHATADLLADLGVGQTVARDYLRHASALTTQDRYTGSSFAALTSAAAALDAAIGDG
ncbi:MAG: tyrosine-type recombinase/integrase [Candidatus Limnocylindrales bacterium]